MRSHGHEHGHGHVHGPCGPGERGRGDFEGRRAAFGQFGPPFGGGPFGGGPFGGGRGRGGGRGGRAAVTYAPRSWPC